MHPLIYFLLWILICHAIPTPTKRKIDQVDPNSLTTTTTTVHRRPSVTHYIPSSVYRRRHFKHSPSPLKHIIYSDKQQESRNAPTTDDSNALTADDSNALTADGSNALTADGSNAVMDDDDSNALTTDDSHKRNQVIQTHGPPVSIHPTPPTSPRSTPFTHPTFLFERGYWKQDAQDQYIFIPFDTTRYSPPTAAPCPWNQIMSVADMLDGIEGIELPSNMTEMDLLDMCLEKSNDLESLDQVHQQIKHLLLVRNQWFRFYQSMIRSHSHLKWSCAKEVWLSSIKWRHSTYAEYQTYVADLCLAVLDERRQDLMQQKEEEEEEEEEKEKEEYSRDIKADKVIPVVPFIQRNSRHQRMHSI